MKHQILRLRMKSIATKIRRPQITKRFFENRCDVMFWQMSAPVVKENFGQFLDYFVRKLYEY